MFEPGTTVAPIIVYMFWLGVGVASLAILMLVVILILRQLVLRRERIRAQAIARWTPWLVPEPDPEPEVIQPLWPREIPGFVQRWNEVHEPLHGRTTPYLARVAREVNLEARLTHSLHSPSFHNRLIAIIALGNIHSEASYKKIEPFLDDVNPTVSLCAARALMQINPQKAVSVFVPHIVEREDWSQGSIAAILDEAGPDVVNRQLKGATLQANAAIAPRLVRFLAGVSPDEAAPIIRKMLATSKDERLLSTCLQVMTRAKDLDLARPLIGHQRWHLRMQAAVTLGRLGGPEDKDRLIPVLSDPQWWVRYRAAQALLGMDFIGAAGLRQIQASVTDKYARDIIEQVLAEDAAGVETRAVA